MDQERRIETLEKRVAQLENMVAAVTTTKFDECNLHSKILSNLPKKYDVSNDSVINDIVKAISKAITNQQVL